MAELGASLVVHNASPLSAGLFDPFTGRARQTPVERTLGILTLLLLIVVANFTWCRMEGTPPPDRIILHAFVLIVAFLIGILAILPVLRVGLAFVASAGVVWILRSEAATTAISSLPRGDRVISGLEQLRGDATFALAALGLGCLAYGLVGAVRIGRLVRLGRLPSFASFGAITGRTLGPERNARDVIAWAAVLQDDWLRDKVLDLRLDDGATGIRLDPGTLQQDSIGLSELPAPLGLWHDGRRWFVQGRSKDVVKIAPLVPIGGYRDERAESTSWQRVSGLRTRDLIAEEDVFFAKRYLDGVLPPHPIAILARCRCGSALESALLIEVAESSAGSLVCEHPLEGLEVSGTRATDKTVVVSINQGASVLELRAAPGEIRVASYVVGRDRYYLALVPFMRW